MAVVLCGGVMAAETRISFAPEYFYWQEEVDGRKILDESGVRFGLDVSSKEVQENNWVAMGRFKLYGGSVDYDGALVNHETREITPFQTDTRYLGGLLEGKYGYRWSLGKGQSLDLMGGLGVEFWQRSLGSQYGYDEYWLPFYAKIGLDVEPGDQGWIGALGIKLPFYTYQWVDLSRLGDSGGVQLAPGFNVAGYGEFGYRFCKWISTSAYFDGYWFGESPVNKGVYQPESKTCQIGLKVGMYY